LNLLLIFRKISYNFCRNVEIRFLQDFYKYDISTALTIECACPKKRLVEQHERIDGASRDAVDDRRGDYERTCANAAAKVGSGRETNTRWYEW